MGSSESWPSKRNSRLKANCICAEVKFSSRKASSAWTRRAVTATSRAAMSKSSNRPGMAVRKCRSTSPVSMPRAVKTPGIMGNITLVISRLRARSQACTGPLPPNAARVKSRGSIPRSTLTARMARAMLALATSRTPNAAASVDRPRGPARSRSIATRALSISRCNPPPASDLGK